MSRFVKKLESSQSSADSSAKILEPSADSTPTPKRTKSTKNIDSKPIKKVFFCDGAISGQIEAILSKHFRLIHTDKDPDYVFYSVMGFRHIEYDCIRIFSTGENVRADFNFCDYAIGYDYMDFGDRYMRYPLYLHDEATYNKAREKHLGISDKDFYGKKRFCTFVVSNGKADELRSAFFDTLNAYKRVDSGGGYKNNIGKRVDDKMAFISEGKFNIAFENSSTQGYITEKLIEALAARTIPIYFGDGSASLPLNRSNAAGGGLNEKAFLQVRESSDFAPIIQKIKELENDEKAYLAMLKTPSFLDTNHKAIFDKKLEAFLLHIFNQPLDSAYRRGFGQWRVNIERRYKKFQNARKLTTNIINTWQTPIRAIKKWLKSLILPKK